MVAKKSTKKTKKTSTKPRTRVSVKKKPESMWRKAIKIIICIAIPLIVGGLSAAIAGKAMMKFNTFNQPPLSPPAWLFPVAWTILYILMGIAFYLIIAKKPRNKQDKRNYNIATTIYIVQLIFNFFWSLIFFLAGQYWFAFVWLMVMWLMIIALMIYAGRRSKAAVWCLLPYLLWCTFAAYLNLGVALLN